MLLDRKTLLFAAEVVEGHDVCAYCGQSLTDESRHKTHGSAREYQEALKIDLVRVLRALAATGVDLKGRFKPRDPA